jgi:acetoin utilization deacetylase AcuC-like enzyme
MAEQQAGKNTGDTFMSTAIYSHPDCLLHDAGSWHPESPARLRAIEDQLILARLDGLLERRLAPLAEPPAILRNHTEAMLALVRDNIPDTPGETYAIDGDTHLCYASYDAARRGAGAALAATDAVIAGDIANAFCATRPPGHHATPTEPMGFCLFNNVAIAALHALESHGLERVAIIDFDVHHGNGTEASFIDDPRVLMASFFQHPYYPGTPPQPITATNVNVPLPRGSGGELVRKVVQEYWLPALHAHRPQMIFISAGFDAHRDDDMGGMNLVEADYAWITREIMQVAREHAGGRIVSCLEGGYELSSLGRSVVAHVKVLADIE